MTASEPEVKLGAAEEESTTEAAPQGLGISTKSILTPRMASHGTGSSAGGTPGFSTIYLTIIAFPPFSGWIAWRTCQCSSYPAVLPHARILQQFQRFRKSPPTIQYSSLTD